MKYVERFVLIFFAVVALFAIHQLVGSLMTSHGWKGLSPSDWASWVQAIGAITAIAVAFILGERQAAVAIRGIRTAENLAVQRKLECIIGISDACAEFAKTHLPSYQPHGFPYSAIADTEWEVDIRHLVTALDAIPIHEIGSIDAVYALIELKKNTTYLQRALQRAAARGAEPDGTNGHDYVFYDTAAITINFDQIQKRAALLKEVLLRQIAA